MEPNEKLWASLKLKGHRITDVYVQTGVGPTGGRMYVVIDDVAMSFDRARALDRGALTVAEIAAIAEQGVGGHGRTAAHVRAALTRQVTRLPADLRRTLTWDQGKEMAEHVRFSVDASNRSLFLRPAQPLAAREQREHQRTAPSVLF